LPTDICKESSNKIDFSKEIMMDCGDYTLTQRKILESYGVDNEYILNVAKVVELDEPLLKTFFCLEDEEWNSFIERIKDVEGTEKNFTSFSLPIYGCWSTLYEHLTSIVNCFKTIHVLGKPTSAKAPPLILLNSAFYVQSIEANDVEFKQTPSKNCFQVHATKVDWFVFNEKQLHFKNI
jgi:hypothetical protein